MPFDCKTEGQPTEEPEPLVFKVTLTLLDLLQPLFGNHYTKVCLMLIGYNRGKFVTVSNQMSPC